VNSTQIAKTPLRIVVCPPELRILQRVVDGEIADATFIIQAYIYQGLQNIGHILNFLGPYYPEEWVFTDNINAPSPAKRTWSETPLFEIVSGVVWRIQLLLRIPYLSVFSNLRLFDASIQHLRGHDLVYERNSLYRFGIAMACKRLRIPYILYFEADDILEHDLMKKPINGLLRIFARRAIKYNLGTADRVICVSEPLKAHLTKNWKVAAEKIVVFPNVADVDRFRPDPDARKEVRTSLGIQDVPLILFVGNFYEWHDVATLLRAFVEVLKDYPNALVMFVGDGTKRKAMERLANELGIDRSVIFTGMVAHKDVPRYMASADIAVVPYPLLEQDIWLSPLKLFEYMATGNAIIASDVGQLSEWICDARNGLLVPPGSISAMANGIKRLIRDPDFRARLGQSAREEAVQKHSWGNYLSHLDDLFFSVISKGNDN